MISSKCAGVRASCTQSSAPTWSSAHVIIGTYTSFWSEQRLDGLISVCPDWLKLGVYPQLAAQLVAGFDEQRIMRQCDLCAFRPSESPAGYLVRAIQGDFELKYPEEEPLAFRALLDLCLGGEVEQAALFAARLTGLTPDGEPERWAPELRAVTRFLLTHGIDPERC